MPAADPQRERQAEAEDELRERYASGPVVHGFKQRAEKHLLFVAELFDFRRFPGEGLDHAYASDVFLNYGRHSAVEVVHFAPLRLQFAGKEGDEPDRRDQRQHRRGAQGRAGGKDERDRRGERHEDVEAQEQAGK